MADDDPYSDDSEFADDHAEREALRHAEAEERRLAALRALGHEGVLTTANAAQAQRVQAIARGRGQLHLCEPVHGGDTLRGGSGAGEGAMGLRGRVGARGTRTHLARRDADGRQRLEGGGDRPIRVHLIALLERRIEHGTLARSNASAR